jgi:NAD-dependent dihydropyrimidine dehydrogenase PreA subunit
MILLTTDQEKCERDGICAEVCPVRIIEFKDKDAFPSLTNVNFGAMMVGYPKFKYQRLPIRNDADIMWR